MYSPSLLVVNLIVEYYKKGFIGVTTNYYNWKLIWEF